MVKAKQKTVLKKQLKKTKKKAVLAVVPKKENQYKPHLIRRYGLLAILVVAVILQLGYNFSQTGSVLGKIIDITPNGLLAATNDKRDEASIPRLKLNEQLTKAAADKAQDIFKGQYWDHTSPSGIDPWYWINQTGYKYEEAGENLAKNFTTANGAVAGWMASDSHRKNMLKPSYTEAGYAIASGELDGEQTTVIVALYAKPVSQTLTTTQGSPYIASAAEQSTADDAKPLSIATRMGIAIQSLTPAAMTSVVLLFISATIATTSHAIRRSLPKRYRKKWYREHGAAKASLLLMIAGFIVLLYGGGSL
ncbi:MAG TPA: CAP domain-containing protein [Candidatus Saccharibacteria bacterium]|nr:CAP domain-containing protein [Candidatus Saccharibacteria bacterium]HMR38638.1 CAP domain-containing protein [Candidatus Saccharibacteria bacterium]